MNLNFIFFGLIEILFSIIVAVITLVLSFKVFAFFTREYDDEKEVKNNNIAVGILSAMFLICIGLALRIASGPALSTLRNTIANKDLNFIKFLIAIGLMLLQLSIAAIVSFLSLLFTLFLLTVISPFKNLKAIMNNNIAIAIIIAAVMLVTILLISDPLLFFLEGLIPKNLFY